MRDGEEPLHQRHPPVEIACGVRIRVVEVHGLTVVGRRVVVVHQCQEHDHAGETLTLGPPRTGWERHMSLAGVIRGG